MGQEVQVGIIQNLFNYSEEFRLGCGHLDKGVESLKPWEQGHYLDLIV